MTSILNAPYRVRLRTYSSELLQALKANFPAEGLKVLAVVGACRGIFSAAKEACTQTGTDHHLKNKIEEVCGKLGFALRALLLEVRRQTPSPPRFRLCRDLLCKLVSLLVLLVLKIEESSSHAEIAETENETLIDGQPAASSLTGELGVAANPPPFNVDTSTTASRPRLTRQKRYRRIGLLLEDEEREMEGEEDCFLFHSANLHLPSNRLPAKNKKRRQMLKMDDEALDRKFAAMANQQGKEKEKEKGKEKEQGCEIGNEQEKGRGRGREREKENRGWSPSASSCYSPPFVRSSFVSPISQGHHPHANNNDDVWDADWYLSHSHYVDEELKRFAQSMEEQKRCLHNFLKGRT